MTTPLHRVDRLAAVSLVSDPDLTGPKAQAAFSSPGSAIATLTAEFSVVWQTRSDDWGLRRTGTLELASGAYVQWIGYGDAVVAEVSSNAFLDDAHHLSDDEQQRLVAHGFARPGDESPNFWSEMRHQGGAEHLALAVVSVLAAVFGVYAG